MFVSLTLLPDIMVPMQAQNNMINMQKQVLEEAAWKEQEVKAQLASLNLLYGQEVETRHTLTQQLSHLKEQSGMDQVCHLPTTSAASKLLCLNSC